MTHLHVELGRLGGEGAASGEVAMLPCVVQIVYDGIAVIEAQRSRHAGAPRWRAKVEIEVLAPQGQAEKASDCACNAPKGDPDWPTE